MDLLIYQLKENGECTAATLSSLTTGRKRCILSSTYNAVQRTNSGSGAMVACSFLIGCAAAPRDAGRWSQAGREAPCRFAFLKTAHFCSVPQKPYTFICTCKVRGRSPQTHSPRSYTVQLVFGAIQHKCPLRRLANTQRLGNY